VRIFHPAGPSTRLASAGAIRGRAPSIEEARRRAEEMLLPLEGVAGVSHRVDPPRIIVYVEREKYRGIVPPEIDGYKTEVVVIGRVKALSLLQLEEGISALARWSGWR
jgi:hypothetical protein